MTKLGKLIFKRLWLTLNQFLLLKLTLVFRSAGQISPALGSAHWQPCNPSFHGEARKWKKLEDVSFVFCCFLGEPTQPSGDTREQKGESLIHLCVCFHPHPPPATPPRYSCCHGSVFSHQAGIKEKMLRWMEMQLMWKKHTLTHNLSL